MIVTHRWPADLPRREVLEGVRVRRLRFELPARSASGLVRFVDAAPRSAAAMVRLAAVFRPNVVHVHGAGPNAVYVAALRRLLGAPLLFSAHGEFRNDAHSAFERSRQLRWALQALLRHAAEVIAPARVVLEELKESFDVRAPTTVVPNAVDTTEFRMAPPPEAVLSPYIFTAGRLVEQKGIDILLRAYGRARESLGGRRLVIAGEGPERDALLKLTADLGLVGVVFTGPVGRRRLVQLMRGADVFAFPSRREAFGIALLEAMAAGTPAVAARVGGIPEFARDGENALLVPPDDPRQLADALIRIVGDAGLRARLAQGGRAQAHLYSWSRIAPRYEALYRSVAHS